MFQVLKNRIDRHPGRRGARPTRRLGIERLEDRSLLAAISWIGEGDASSWNDTANWNLGRLPLPGDDVSIPDVAATTEVLLSGTQSFDSLVSDEAVRIQGADVTVPGTIQVNNSLLIQTATVNDATILPGVGFPEIQITTGGTTLRNTTMNADLSIVFIGGTPPQIDNMTLNGTLSLDGHLQGGISFIGPTLDGTGQIVTTSASTNPSFAPIMSIADGLALNIGPDILIHGLSGAATFSSNGTATLINEGTITADGIGLGFSTFGTVDVVNHGTIEAINGGRFSSTAQFTNTGTLQSVNTSQFSTLTNLTSNGVVRSDAGLLQITNLTTQPGIDLEVDSGGLIRLINVDNNGNTVTLDHTNGNVVLQGGTWEGGTIDGTSSLLWGGGGKLQDVVLNANATTFTTGGVPGFENLTLNGTIFVPAGINSLATQTLSGSGDVVFDAPLAHLQPLVDVAAGTTLTLGPDITVRGNGNGGFRGGSGSELINLGTIIADVPSAGIGFISLNVDNQSIIEATSGASLSFQSTTSLNNAGIVRGTGANVTISGPTTGSGTIRSDGSFVIAFDLTPEPGLSLETDNGGEVRLVQVHGAGQTVTLDHTNGIVSLHGTWDGGAIDGPSPLHVASKLKDVVVNNEAIFFGSGSQFEHVTLNGQFTVTGNAASNISQTLAGTGVVALSGGNVPIAAGQTLTLGPDITVRGNGRFNGDGSLINEGTMAADEPAGMIEVNGPYTQTSDGALEVAIADVGFANHGFLRATDSVSLDGGLVVSFVGGFTPSVGQSFPIVDKSGSDPIVGNFTDLPDGTVFSAGGVSLQITYDGFSGNDAVLTVVDTAPPVITVDADVKPGDGVNKVNAKSQGVIPIAIYTTAGFDAATIDVDTVRLGGTLAADHFALEDVDGDGDLDLVLHFRTQAVLNALGLDLENGDSELVEVELTGETVDEVMFQGFDTIEFFRPGKGKGKK